MAKHIINHPYWYDSSVTPFTPMWEDGDLEPLHGMDQLKGLFTAPNSEYYYPALDRITDLTNSTYKPNNPYAYGYCYLTHEFEENLPPTANLNSHYNYIDLDTATTILNLRHGTSRSNVVFVPVSVKLGSSPALHRDYYMELHVATETWTAPADIGRQVALGVKLCLRAHDTEVGTDNLITDNNFAGSGYVVYENYTYNYAFNPYFVYWSNDDAEEPKIIYWMGMTHLYYNTPLNPNNLRVATGSNITDNGHTFTELWPRPGNSGFDTKLFMCWESDAYHYYNPNNDIAFDQLEEDMGPFGPESERDGYPEQPGDGHGDDTSDSIAIPEDPLIGVTNVGFVNVYRTGLSSLQDIGVELFPDLQYTNPQPISGSSDVVDSIQNGFNAIITALANIPSIVSQQVAATLINYIIDCHVLPVTPTGGTPENIKVGYKTLSATGDRLSTDYVPFDCGTIKLGEYYSSFADFMTSAKLFLPFVGFVPARPEWFYADTLGVKYKFNVIDGSFVAYVTSTGKYVNNNNSGGTVVAQYSGNACVHLPITGVTYASMVSGLVGAGAGAVASAGSGNIAGVASSVVNAAGASGDIPQSNSYASSGAFLSVRRPYLLIERPVTNYSPTFRKERGLPSNISKKLSTMSGFTILQDVHLDGITATDAEKKELEDLLSKGVIF